jgi:hypothetical protein
VKCAYLFCRYYPLAIAPFHFWGFMGDHEKRVCESYYPALYYCTIPMVRTLPLPVKSFFTISWKILSAQCKPDKLERAFKAVIDFVLSYSDVAYVCVLWEEKMGSRRSFNYAPRSSRRYYLGDEQRVIPSVSMTFFIKAHP